MATIKRVLPVDQAQFPASVMPQLRNRFGTNHSFRLLAYDAATDQAAFWLVKPFSIVGAATFDLEIEWYAETASTGVVRWECAAKAVTPNTDSDDYTTITLGTAVAADDTHLGTTGKRVHRAVISGIDAGSVADGDIVVVRVRRLGSHANDTMAGNANILSATMVYSDI